MTMRPLPQSERLLDILIERATQGIPVEREQELDELLKSETCDDLTLVDHAASLVELAFLEHYYQPMPSRLKSQIMAKVPSRL